ncbi:tRNA lysidine(34) synthetase TilS [Luteolibacter pohnpeiensis]|uniref:tRNA(Ile)-lysidine synthase n=1 Tax=Luteolibacter pohnpeiensis TaxID=454153 RepID=A0A934S6M5_9BACT|nr:tRNA lysidine(34) synthetase TilS [Luteolibacter pohnpeiensis]MBK1882149.1 tRNA lysidine(34) synthetase TilS [Luteolibacter pohnpeiensis]
MSADWFDQMPKTHRWLVGVSGGADSMALLNLLVDQGFRELVVCHLNHRLRGAAADDDADFVANAADRLGLSVEMGTADVPSLMQKSGISLETAAREARQDFFANCASRWQCPRVILAHHAEDQAETVLWNLLRGSHGCRGMQRERTMGDLTYFRPLLGVRRAELRDYLRSKGLPWREDASNAEPIAVRNRLRNEAMPLLAEISGRDLVQALGSAAESDAGLREIAAFALHQAEVRDPQGRLHLPKMRTLPVALQKAALVAFLADAGVGDISRRTISCCIELLSPEGPTAVDLANGKRLRRRAGRLLVESQHGQELD